MTTAWEHLRKYQKQADPEGMEVTVSKQALDETLDRIDELQTLHGDGADDETISKMIDLMDENRDLKIKLKELHLVGHRRSAQIDIVYCWNPEIDCDGIMNHSITESFCPKCGFVSKMEPEK